MCEYMKGVFCAVGLLAIVGLAILVDSESSSRYRVTEDDDDLGYWLEEDD